MTQNKTRCCRNQSKEVVVSFGGEKSCCLQWIKNSRWLGRRRKQKSTAAKTLRGRRARDKTRQINKSSGKKTKKQKRETTTAKEERTSLLLISARYSFFPRLSLRCKPHSTWKYIMEEASGRRGEMRRRQHGGGVASKWRQTGRTRPALRHAGTFKRQFVALICARKSAKDKLCHIACKYSVSHLVQGFIRSLRRFTVPAATSLLPRSYFTVANLSDVMIRWLFL